MGKEKPKDSSLRNSLFLDDESLRKKQASSSFHEYIPGHNVPLKERLRRKQMQGNQNEKTENRQDDFNSVIVPDHSLAQRASKIIRAKYHGDKDNEEIITTPTQQES